MHLESQYESRQIKYRWFNFQKTENFTGQVFHTLHRAKCQRTGTIRASVLVFKHLNTSQAPEKCFCFQNKSRKLSEFLTSTDFIVANKQKRQCWKSLSSSSSSLQMSISNWASSGDTEHSGVSGDTFRVGSSPDFELMLPAVCSVRSVLLLAVCWGC